VAVSEESKSSMSPESAEDAEEAADVVENPEASEKPEEADEPDREKSGDKKTDTSKRRGRPFTKRIRRRKNPLRSGNPAKVAAERERMRSSRAAANRVSRVPVKVKSLGSPRWYAPTMVTLMIIGLLWVVVTYLSKGQFPLPYFTRHYRTADWRINGNLYVGFLIMMLGFLGLLRWK